MPMKIISTMALALLLPATIFPVGPSVGAASGSNDVKEMLNNLTDEQRRSLNELNVDKGFTIHPDINLRSTLPERVIVEFKQEPAKVEMAKNAGQLVKKVSQADLNKKVEESHKRFKAELNSLTKSERSTMSAEDYEITREYRNALNGVAMTLPGNEVEGLFRTGVVKRIWKDKEIQLTLPEDVQVEPKMMDSIPQIGVDQLHAENITGQGITVGVIDSGIDYNHPDLASAYAGYRAKEGEDAGKIDPASVKGWDFVNNDADPMETTYQEWKASNSVEFHPATGSSYYTSHGTHVSGTVAANPDSNVAGAVKGVAPDVDLYVYRVLGPYGMGSDSNVIAGIDKAVKDEMDVINLSLGTDVNDPLDAGAIAVNNAMLSGVVTVVAAGNSGPTAGTIGSPGAAALPITVGASNASLAIPTFSANYENEAFTDIQLLGKNFTDNLAELENQSYPIVDVGMGSKSDYVGRDMKGKIAFIQRNGQSFPSQILTAIEAGAMAVMMYNDLEGQIPYYVGEDVVLVPSFRMSKEDGLRLKSILTDETQFTFGTLTNTHTKGDLLASFSSRGPVVSNYDIKPDLVAPGVMVYSTFPGFMNDPEEGKNYDIAYARNSGTSMAAPHVAGTAALILQQNPAFSTFDVKTALMNTAVDLQEEYNVYEVGAGRMDAYEAVHTDVAVQVHDKTQHVENGEVVEIDDITGSIAYGYHFPKGEEAIIDSRKVVIENKGSGDKEFTIEVDFSTAKGDIQNAEANGVLVTSLDTIKVEAGKREEIQPTIEVPWGADTGRYEGYIRMTNTQDENDSYKIPFSIRVADEGLEYARVSRPMMTNETYFHPYLTPYVNLYFQLSSPLTTIDLLVKDQETGKAVGYMGTLNASELMPGMGYTMRGGFNGEVFPFTDDPANPIADKKIALTEGVYTLEFIGREAEGKTFTKSSIVMIDNTPPEFELSMEPGIYEVDESMYSIEEGYNGPAIWVHGKVYDSAVDVLKSKGIAIDQSTNGVMWWEDSMYVHDLLSLSAEGNFRIPAAKSKIEGYDANNPLTSNLFVFDNATAATNFLETTNKYTWLKKGTEYMKLTYDKKKVHLNESITVTMNMNNVKEFSAGEFRLPFNTSLFKFESAKVNDEFKRYAEEKGATVKLDQPKVSSGTVSIAASVDQKDFSLDEDLPFVDVTFTLTNDKFYENSAQFELSMFILKNSVESDRKPIRVYHEENFSIISKSSMVDGSIKPEAFLGENGTPDYNAHNFIKIGAKVYAKTADGKKYNGEIDKYGFFVINGVPVSKDDVEIYVEAPGHLTSKLATQIGRTIDGELSGEFYRASIGKSYAGDINGDGMIDMNDVMRVVAHYGKSNAQADINQDGVVDEKDVRFIEANFLKIGPTASKNAKPVEKNGKKGLQELLLSIGLEAKE
ncbi:S8 family serine peptidase [Sporosarcina sp. NPDC096371]|uniref:S8 family serine peptidase n=1 Tax=Sporosarcina sp. NPDC096371 TaxID=3364530 RepID=UPI00382D21DE